MISMQTGSFSRSISSLPTYELVDTIGVVPYNQHYWLTLVSEWVNDDHYQIMEELISYAYGGVVPIPRLA